MNNTIDMRMALQDIFEMAWREEGCPEALVERDDSMMSKIMVMAARAARKPAQ
jgi:hypothetical protein